MTPELRSMIAFVAASLRRGRPFTHVYDHEAGREIAMGGIVRPDQVTVVEGGGARLEGEPKALLHSVSNSYVQLEVDGQGFSGYDYASEAHFKGLFQEGGAVQLFDHQSGRYHAYHVS